MPLLRELEADYLTLITPSLKKPSSLSWYNVLKSSTFAGRVEKAIARMNFFSFVDSCKGSENTATWPPGEIRSKAVCWVGSEEMASTMVLMGASLVMLLISERRAALSRLRSRMWVAPIALSASLCVSDAVVMMGEKPDSFASWIAGPPPKFH